MFWRTQTKLKGLTPAIGASPNFVLPQKVLSDSNSCRYDFIGKYIETTNSIREIKSLFISLIEQKVEIYHSRTQQQERLITRFLKIG